MTSVKFEESLSSDPTATTSLAVLLGAGGLALGWRQADPLGLLITIANLGVLRYAVRQVGAGLMDAVDPHLVEPAPPQSPAWPEFSTSATLRIRWIGHTLPAEIDITVPADLTLAQPRHAAADRGTVVRLGFPLATPPVESVFCFKGTRPGRS